MIHESWMIQMIPTFQIRFKFKPCQIRQDHSNNAKTSNFENWSLSLTDDLTSWPGAPRNPQDSCRCQLAVLASKFGGLRKSKGVVMQLQFQQQKNTQSVRQSFIQSHSSWYLIQQLHRPGSSSAPAARPLPRITSCRLFCVQLWTSALMISAFLTAWFLL